MIIEIDNQTIRVDSITHVSRVKDTTELIERYKDRFKMPLYFYIEITLSSGNTIEIGREKADDVYSIYRQLQDSMTDGVDSRLNVIK